MWQWPSGEMLSWERSLPSRESARALSTIFPLLGYTVRLTIRALPFRGMICAAGGWSQCMQRCAGCRAGRSVKLQDLSCPACGAASSPLGSKPMSVSVKYMHNELALPQ